MGTKTLLLLVLVFVFLLKGGSAVEILTSCRDCWCLDACKVIVAEKSSHCRALCFHKNKHPETHSVEYVDDLFNNDWSHRVETIPHLIFYRDKDIDSLAIRIDCTSLDIGDMSILNTTVNDLIPKLDLNNEIGLTLEYCPFLDQSFVRTLNMTSVKQLKVIGSPDDIRLSSNYFDEHFRSVKFISFRLNDGLKSVDEDVFKGTPHLIDLELKSNQITSLDPGVFQHLTKLQSLDLSYNKIADLKPNIFQGLPSLYNLNIKNNQLVNLTSGLFSNILNLRTLDISCNNISALHSGVFYGNFTHLYLQENKISTVDPDVFRHLGNLKKLDLSHNRITDLEPNIFQGLTSLESLRISNNQLVSLAQGLFQNCQKLETLHLVENELNYLGETPFELLRNLELVYLKGNQLEKITDGMINGTHDIVLLDLSHNKLNVISQTAFDILCKTNSELHAINLSDNILEWNSNLVDSPFNECESITELTLSNNRISYIHNDWIMGIQWLDLNGNNITILPDFNSFTSKSKEMTLVVSDNQIKTFKIDSDALNS
uniref:Insulin-like growth factor-binding protein complex acid labile subunit n=1 Tax=Cacopsylla melanoneura TaxID=428564 RepID=A0A8D9BSL4_9HEMI